MRSGREIWFWSSALGCSWPPPKKTTSPGHAEEPKLRSKGASHSAALRDPSRLGVEKVVGRFRPLEPVLAPL